MSTFNIQIADELIEVDINDDVFEVSLSEDHIDVDIIEESVNVDLTEEVVNVELKEEVINVTLDGSAIILPSEGGFDASSRYSHDGTLLVGDLVYMSPTIELLVIKALDNNSINPIIGIVTEVISSTIVRVSHMGFYNTTEAIVQGHKVYVSDTGTMTTVLPTTYYIQILGAAISTGKIFFNPELRRIKRA